MQLVDDRVFEGNQRIDHTVALDHRLIHQTSTGHLTARAPGTPTAEGPRVWIEQNRARIEPVSLVTGTVDPVAVAELIWQAVNPDVPMVSCSVVERMERDCRKRLALTGL